MRAFGKLALVQVKLYFREPIIAFFALGFGPVLLLLSGLAFGNTPQELLGGRGPTDIAVPSYAAIVIGITGLATIPITAVTRRETGVLRRFAATPLKPLTYFLADILAPFTLTLLGILLLLALGKLVYHVQFAGHWLSVIAGICLSMLAFFSLGYALAGVIPTARLATVIGNVLITPMGFLSGAFVPLEIMPNTVQTIARFLPLTYVITLVKGLWFGESWGAHWVDAVVLAGISLVAIPVVALTFKWE